MIGSVSFTPPSRPHSIDVATQAKEPHPKPEFRVEPFSNTKTEVADAKPDTEAVEQETEQVTGKSKREHLERMIKYEQRLLEVRTDAKQRTKEWAERIPGQILEIQEQLSVAGPDTIGGLTERLASLNSTLISVSDRYAKIVEGWDEYVTNANDNIAKLRAQLDGITNDNV